MQAVRLRDAGIAQLVEHNLAKVGVASSSLVSRSKFRRSLCGWMKKSSTIAGIAQLVEHNLAKVGVASSSLVSRSKLQNTITVMVSMPEASLCGNSSVGRAQPCQGWGREFESRFPLQFSSSFYLISSTSSRYSAQSAVIAHTSINRVIHRISATSSPLRLRAKKHQDYNHLIYKYKNKQKIEIWFTCIWPEG